MCTSYALFLFLMLIPPIFFILFSQTGNMEFDMADVQAMIDAGTWESVIIHEMGHIIGETDCRVIIY